MQRSARPVLILKCLCYTAELWTTSVPEIFFGYHVIFNKVTLLPVRTKITLISFQCFQFGYGTCYEKCRDPRPLLNTLVWIPHLFHVNMLIQFLSFGLYAKGKTNSCVRLLVKKHNFSNRFHSLQQLEPHWAAPCEICSIFYVLWVYSGGKAWLCFNYTEIYCKDFLPCFNSLHCYNSFSRWFYSALDGAAHPTSLCARPYSDNECFDLTRQYETHNYLIASANCQTSANPLTQCCQHWWGLIIKAACSICTNAFRWWCSHSIAALTGTAHKLSSSGFIMLLWTLKNSFCTDTSLSNWVLAKVQSNCVKKHLTCSLRRVDSYSICIDGKQAISTS